MFLKRATKPSHSKPCPASVEKNAHLPRVVYCAIYSQYLLASQSFEFLICILLALKMPLIRCTNVFYQGRLSRHINSPSDKTLPTEFRVSYLHITSTQDADNTLDQRILPREAITSPFCINCQQLLTFIQLFVPKKSPKRYQTNYLTAFLILTPV